MCMQIHMCRHQRQTGQPSFVLLRQPSADFCHIPQSLLRALVHSAVASLTRQLHFTLPPPAPRTTYSTASASQDFYNCFASCVAHKLSPPIQHLQYKQYQFLELQKRKEGNVKT